MQVSTSAPDSDIESDPGSSGRTFQWLDAITSVASPDCRIIPGRHSR